VGVQEPLSLEETAERFVRPSLQQALVDLCSQSIAKYLERFGFRSDLVKAMYATTDGFSGLSGGWESPGTGMNFLMHNMCRLGGADGTWMIVEGGMGSITQSLAAMAIKAGAVIETAAPVDEVVVEGGVAKGVRMAGGGDREIRAKAVLVNADPFRLKALLPPSTLPHAFEERLQHWKKDGMTMKVCRTCSPHPISLLLFFFFFFSTADLSKIRQLISICSEKPQPLPAL
jgi:phytoene dehydrogenase-like protein